MKYTAITYPIQPQGNTSRKRIYIGSTDGQSDLFLKTLTYTLSVRTPVTQGVMVCTAKNPMDQPLYVYVKEGDAITIYEEDPELAVSKIPAFTGIITSVRFRRNATAGTEIVIYFANLLWQWAGQAAIDNSDVTSQGITDEFSNAVPLGKLLSLLVNGSVVQLLTSEGVLGTESSYNGTDLPILCPTLTLDSLVWVYIAVNMHKLDALTSTLYPYQQLVYQEANGTIVIDVPHLKQIPHSYFNFSENPSSPNIKNIEVAHNATMIPNKLVGTLVNFFCYPPLNPPPGADPSQYQNAVVEVDNQFPRASELLKSGYFEMNVVDNYAMNNINTDPTLLSYLAPLNDSGYFAKTLSGTTTIAGTYAARTLAEANTDHTTCSITVPRKGTLPGSSNSIIDFKLPLGYLVPVTFPSFLASGETQMYCHTIRIDHSMAGTDLTLEMCLPYSISALWQ